MNSSLIIDSGTISNTIPLLNFFGYIIIVAILTSLALRNILPFDALEIPNISTEAPPSKRNGRIGIFSVLSIIALGTTVVLNIQSFAFSYGAWAAEKGIKIPADLLTTATILRFNNKLIDYGHTLQLGDWFVNRKLFDEVWDATTADVYRYWWTQQIFHFSAVWCFFLAREGVRRQVSHVWAFMLLGQLFSLSFASNLFFLAVLVNPPKSKEFPHVISWWKLIIQRITVFIATLEHFVSVNCIQAFHETSWFFSLLVAPHLFVFIPIMFASKISNHTTFMGWFFCQGLGSLMVYTIKYLGLHGLSVVWDALVAHPVIHLVGEDVFLCWISFGMWTLLEGWGTDKASTETKVKRG